MLFHFRIPRTSSNWLPDQMPVRFYSRLNNNTSLHTAMTVDYSPSRKLELTIHDTCFKSWFPNGYQG